MQFRSCCSALVYFFPSWISEFALLALLIFKEALIYFFEWVKDWKASKSPDLGSLASEMPFRSWCPALVYFVPSCISEFAFLILLIFKEASAHFFELAKNWKESRTFNLASLASAMPFRSCCSAMAQVGHKVGSIGLLDLPDLTVDCILEKLSVSELAKMSGVCSHLREISWSHYLRKRHMKEKWARIVGEAAFRKWEMQVSSKMEFDLESEFVGASSNGWLGFMSRFSRSRSKTEFVRKPRITMLMSFYLALESGTFSFPAQIYNRENGSEDFMLSCYDAEISYNRRANKFYARYPPHGKKVPAIEEVQWERIRAPPVTNSAHDLHISECLAELKPGDHIEIQWRNNKDLPYGWWYGVVGHLEVCHGNAHLCFCQSRDIIAVEFSHHAPGSKWRRKMINRNEHLEDGNEIDGFYGGIRKIQTKEEISTWLQFWPAQLQS